MRAGARTDVGVVRQLNEDRYLVADQLFAVCDGLGGHQAGEVASATAVETLREAFTEPTVECLVAAVKQANRAIFDLAQSQPDKRGMGTTITAVAVVDDGDEEQLAVVNVGDSRTYLMRDGELTQLTEDDSLVGELEREGRLTREEALIHPSRSVITRALGLEADIAVDNIELLSYKGDRLVLCSDGLTNEVSDDRVSATLRRLADPEEAAADLVRQARENGGSDNITVVVVDVVDDDERSERASAALAAERSRSSPRASEHTVWLAPTDEERPEPPAGAVAIQDEPDEAEEAAAPVAARRRLITWRVVLFLALLLAVLGSASAAVAWYARNTYYVGLDGDRVAVFRGRPGGLLWFKPTLDRRTPLTVADVPAIELPAVRAGKQQATRADADRYVNNLRQQSEQARQQAVPPTTAAPPAGAAPPTSGPP